MKSTLRNGTAIALLALAGCATQSATDAPATAAQPAPGGSAPQARSAAAPAPAMSASAVASRSVYYDFDRSDLRADQRGTVEANAKYLQAHPGTSVRIEGNADERGSREYNLALGQRRAETVMKSMGLLGVPAARMESVSYGSEKPKASGHDEGSWAENRRSDIVYP